jgi:hypothetical protein
MATIDAFRTHIRSDGFQGQGCPAPKSTPYYRKRLRPNCPAPWVNEA